ncbi:Autophagy-related protein 37 [Fulvia fulva]|uniref:Autophagy-related protein 37 n=1 Tax=Passalora fulva TaxID=5499 RepID=A0A9Q8P5M6_PASFU|nr:Autophagy-related protein 37 [Fulvia fulva]KAK4631872.1 Autophagy-related protein 37 [Fulvia fulva]KAK4632687.1 Autophagy-related protein 37 [Fulvia fulva]UJO14084.1 Autophagy-related protein 37 [Fulvia fulva]WPV11227.1 Autophagy-related protein 37 [Fulvia fulva]WPV25542.1 Autophagy-related protein 37 [Fulvia fulva]
MADSIDRVFGHALITVNKIRPGSQKPPSADRLALYGLYKQSMEGDVAHIADRPSSSPSTPNDQLKKEQEQWDAWKANEGLSRTEAKRRYIERLISTMHKYASTTPEARELVEELEFVWDQIKNNSQHSSSEHSSPLQTIERRDYMHSGGSSGNNGGASASAAALESGGKDSNKGLRVLSPQSEADEDEAAEDEREEFVDAPISQIDEADLQEPSEPGNDGSSPDRFLAPRRPIPSASENRWRRRMESSLIKLTTEITALREQLESRRWLNYQRKHSWLGWVARLSWWAVQLVVADAVILWIVILYMRRKQDRRLEGAVRVLLGDAVAQVQNLGTQVKIPAMPRIRKPKE